MKKILILYATYGGGHYSAAKSIYEYIQKNYTDVEAEIVDCVRYINKAINKISIGAYHRITSKAPWAWKKVYYNSERGLLSRVSSGTNKLMAKKLNHLIRDSKPDVIISTHMFSTQMVSYLKKKGKVNCKLATVLTDFAPHDQWLIGSDYGDFFFVSNEKMKQSMVTNNGIDENKIHITGIPISQKFSLEFNTDEIYKSFGLSPSMKTILLFGGGEFGIGRHQTIEIFKTLTTFIDKYQILVISGKNKKLKAAFEQIAKEIGNPSNIKILGFVDTVPEAMHISDVVITKPGGLTTSESLASHLPMVVINPIPGQEEENAEFLEEAGIAVWLRKHDDANAVISNLLNSEKMLESMKQNTEKLAHIYSTKNICDTILNNL